MAENGNGEDGGAWGPLITHDEMAIAFELAERLGIKDQFGGASPLGGLVILILKLSLELGKFNERLTKQEQAFKNLQQTVGAIQKKIGFTLNDL